MGRTSVETRRNLGAVLCRYFAELTLPRRQQDQGLIHWPSCRLGWGCMNIKIWISQSEVVKTTEGTGLHVKHVYTIMSHASNPFPCYIYALTLLLDADVG